MRLRPVLALLLIASSAACAAESADVASDASEAQSTVDLSRAKIVEATRFRHAGQASGVQDGASVASYRFNGFGGTKVKITVKPQGKAFAPTVVLAGPIPGDDAKVVLQRKGTAASGVTFETTLDARGAYRLLVGTREAFAGASGSAGAFDVAFTCEAGCDLPEVTLGDVLADVKSQMGADGAKAGLEQLVAAQVADPDLRAKITSGLLDVLARGTSEDVAEPVIPMSMLGVAQGIFEHAPPPKTVAEAPKPIDVELGQIGADCKVSRGGPAKDLTSSIPGLSISDVPDYTYDDCALARIEGLAAALNALSLDDGSVVRDGDAKYASVGDLVTALVQKGHTITLDNSRYFADFVGLNYKGATVRAPVWIDTAIPVPGGGTLKMPAPHAHHNVWIKGPEFDGQLKFYMGVDNGTAFRAQSTIPRAWSGGKATYTIEAEDDVVKVLSLAGQLRKKWLAAGKDLPMMGYGRIGVCTDSTAILEYALKGTATLFPLAHPKSDASADEIDRILGKLPSDTSGFDADDALRRIGATIPFENVSDVPFKPFRDAWSALGK
jgi:hypothetical protein